MKYLKSPAVWVALGAIAFYVLVGWFHTPATTKVVTSLPHPITGAPVQAPQPPVEAPKAATLPVPAPQPKPSQQSPVAPEEPLIWWPLQPIPTAPHPALAVPTFVPPPGREGTPR